MGQQASTGELRFILPLRSPPHLCLTIVPPRGETTQVTNVGVIIPLPSVVSLADDVDRAVRPVDQTEGQPGLTEAAEGVVWRCLIIGCGTSNSVRDLHCATCLSPPPKPEMVRRAKLHQDRLASEKQSHIEQLGRMRSQHEVLRAYMEEAKDTLAEATNSQGESTAAQEKLLESTHKATAQLTKALSLPHEGNEVILVSSVPVQQATKEQVDHLLKKVDPIHSARYGDTQVLQELDNINALGSISDIVNKGLRISGPVEPFTHTGTVGERCCRFAY